MSSLGVHGCPRLQAVDVHTKDVCLASVPRVSQPFLALDVCPHDAQMSAAYLYRKLLLGASLCSLSCTRLRVPLVALHVSRYTCRATRVAADFLNFTAFCRCSTGVALHPPQILVSHLPPPVHGGVAPKFGSEKVSRYTGVSQPQLRVSRYTVQLSLFLGGTSNHYTLAPDISKWSL